MRRTAVATLAAVFAAGLIAAGCGDDDETTTTAATTTGATGATGAAGAAGGEGGEPLSKSEFIKQADEICAEGDQEINQQGQETFQGGQPSQEELEQFATDVVAPGIQQQIDGIQELTPPEGDEDEVSAILDAAQEGVDMIEADPSVLGQGQDAGGSFAEANRLAQDYGLKECGGG